MLHFIFFSSPLLSLLFFSSFPSSSPLLSPPLFIFISSSFHPHSLLYRNPAICYFSYSFLRSTFYHHLFDVMRLQKYAFIGQMTLLSNISSGNPDDGGGQKSRIRTREVQYEERRGQKPTIRTRDNEIKGRRGQKGRICTRGSRDLCRHRRAVT